MDERRHYLCRVRLNGTAIFVVWYSDGRDGFVRDDAGRLRVAKAPEALTAAVVAQGILLMGDEPADYDFDRIRAWCAAPEGAGVDCKVFLDAWNFLDDLAGLYERTETPYARLSRGTAGCYDKLFWGCNLPAVTPPGERFDPEWLPGELAAIRMVLETGLRLLESELHAASVGA